MTIAADIYNHLVAVGGVVPEAVLRDRHGVQSNGALRVHISALRQTLPSGVTVVNEYGRGYRLSTRGNAQ